MKRILILCTFLFMWRITVAQLPDGSAPKYPQMICTDMGQATMIVMDSYWDNKKEVLVKQVGEQMFEKIKKYSIYKFKPKQMNAFDGKGLIKKEDRSAHHEKLGKLKMYKVAEYNHIFEGKDWGKKIVLMVPYKGNENWDSSAKWDTVFFLVKEEYVKPVNYLSSKTEVNSLITYQRICADTIHNSLFVMDGYWDNKKDVIVRQIGEELFEKVKKYSNYRSMPKQMVTFDGKQKRSRSESTVLYAKLAKLKMYKIAEYDHIFEGKNWGTRLILMVPYKGNEDWDSTAKWDTVYFLVHKKDVWFCLDKDQSSDFSSYPRMTCTDFKQKTLMVAEGYWDNKKDTIIKQVGEEMFNKIKKFSSFKYMPSEMSLFDGKRRIKTEDQPAHYEKLAKLKMYKIAEYNHIFEGKNLGKTVVLMIPYKGNEDWDPMVKWDTVFFLIKEKYLQPAKD